MEVFISFLVGFISGLLYNEHLYRQTIIFPAKNPFFSFWVRISLLGVVLYLVVVHFSFKGVVVFLIANLVARFIHIILRGFVIVRY